MAKGKISFDGWTVDCDSGELSNGRARVRLAPKPLRLLVILLAHPGQVVTREQLTCELWPKGFLEFDTALNSAVRRLRRALGDDAGTPKYIETLPRFGYRFIGTITHPDSEQLTEPGQTPGSGAPALAGAVVDSPARPDCEPALRNDTAVPHARGRLSATLVSRGPYLALAAALLLFSFSFVPRALQPPSEPAADSAGASNGGDVQLREAREVAALRSMHPAAAETYQRARFLLQRRGPDDLARAQGYFERVIARAPAFAPAYSGLASVYFHETASGLLPRGVGLARVMETSEAALAIDGRLAEALVRESMAASRTGDRTTAERYLSRAIAADPTHPLVLATLASRALAQGNARSAVELTQRAVAADPLDLELRYDLADALYRTGDLRGAQRAAEELLELEPDYEADVLAFIHILRGEPERALGMAAAWREGSPRRETLALAYAALGRASDSDRVLAELAADARDLDALRIAEVYAFRGDRKRALAWLRAFDTPEHAGLQWAARSSPFLAPLGIAATPGGTTPSRVLR